MTNKNENTKRRNLRVTKMIALSIAIIAGVLVVLPQRKIDKNLLLTISAIAFIVAGRKDTQLANQYDEDESEQEN